MSPIYRIEEIQESWPLGLRLRAEGEPTIVLLDLAEQAVVVRGDTEVGADALRPGVRVRVQESPAGGTITRIEILDPAPAPGSD